MPKRERAALDPAQSKRSRWDSDSDPEVESELDAALEPDSAPEVSEPHDDSPSRAAEAEHNSLWFGCRSVDAYEPLNRIDEGTYGVVFRAKDTATGEVWALKKVKLSPELEQREGFPHTALREINILLALRHENIVRVREMVVGSTMDAIYMVMEYFENDFKQVMAQIQRPFSQGEVKCLLKQLLSAIAFMHRNWFFHRDLKSSNLLYSNNGKLAVCDFGLARRYTEPLEAYTQPVVTLWYRCPELLLGATHYGPEVDVWSVGCLLGEFLLKEPLLWGKEGEADQIRAIFENLGAPNEHTRTPDAQTWPGFSALPGASNVNWKKIKKRGVLRERIPKRSVTPEGPFIDDDGFDLLVSLLRLNPKDRISCDEALQHVYFKRFPLAAQPEEMPKFSAQNEKSR